MISGCCCCIDENCAPLSYYTSSSGNFLLTYHYLLHNNPKIGQFSWLFSYQLVTSVNIFQTRTRLCWEMGRNVVAYKKMIKLLELYKLYFIINMHFKEWQLTTWKHWSCKWKMYLWNTDFEECILKLLIESVWSVWCSYGGTSCLYLLGYLNSPTLCDARRLILLQNWQLFLMLSYFSASGCTLQRTNPVTMATMLNCFSARTQQHCLPWLRTNQGRNNWTNNPLTPFFS